MKWYYYIPFVALIFDRVQERRNAQAMKELIRRFY